MQDVNKVYLGFRIPEPDRDLDQASECVVLVSETFLDDGQWLAQTPRHLEHVCLGSTPRAKAFRAKYGCHSPTGYNWGYGGSGPAELALMILIDLDLGNDLAWRAHQAFKADVIAALPVMGPWQLSEYDIRRWLAVHMIETLKEAQNA